MRGCPCGPCICRYHAADPDSPVPVPPAGKGGGGGGLRWRACAHGAKGPFPVMPCHHCYSDICRTWNHANAWSFPHTALGPHPRHSSAPFFVLALLPRPDLAMALSCRLWRRVARLQLFVMTGEELCLLH